MTCKKSKSTNGDHCRHGLAQTCCWCGEAAHGPFVPSLPPQPWNPSYIPPSTGYTCGLCGVWVFGNGFHYCPGYKGAFSVGSTGTYRNPR